MNALRMHPDDRWPCWSGTLLPGIRSLLAEGEEPVIVARQAIPYGHKVALRPIRAGEPVIKYGERMGIATADIEPGEHVHVHNVRGLKPEERGVAVNG